MLSMVLGQKVKLTDLITQHNQLFFINIQLQAPELNFDMACFGLDVQKRLSDDRYMTFYNQPKTPCGSIELQQNSSSQTVFAINLNHLVPAVNHLVFTATIDGQGIMSQLQQGKIQILNTQHDIVAELNIAGSLFQQERAVMLLELYRKDDIWRVAAIGQGFNAGLAALIDHFGGEVAQEASKPLLAQVPIDQSVQSVVTPAVNLTKISLDKKDASYRISLNKAEQKTLLIEAVWIDNGDNNTNNDDLDLRVGLLVYGKDQLEYIHAPERSGSLTEFPFVRHLGDVRQASKTQPGVEKIEVNADIAKLLGAKVGLVFSVYSAVSNGVVSIASLRPSMRMQYGNQLVECVFNPEVSPKAKSRFVYTYVIGTAMIDEEGIVLQHSGQTSGRFSEATPRLSWVDDQLTVSMDGKPIFKNN